jgi:hypothetical protein
MLRGESATLTHSSASLNRPVLLQGQGVYQVAASALSSPARRRRAAASVRSMHSTSERGRRGGEQAADEQRPVVLKGGAQGFDGEGVRRHFRQPRPKAVGIGRRPGPRGRVVRRRRRGLARSRRKRAN